ncbi:choline dehydrogenase-like flavoprotein [Sphingomonas zeicaulis]|uniref:GMC oxidoreductase n=1 Tax=Sphingomonas zeicaulis TaxID=1632740 RepID=UPI003D1A61A1
MKAEIDGCGPSGPAMDDWWDVIVVGTGLGGATIGHRLAQAGHRVLFLEKGKESFPPLADPDIAEPEDPAERLDRAHWPDRVSVTVDSRPTEMFAPLGCGAGGSSQLYAATLERFERSDVESVAGLPHPTGGWPIRWADLQRYYGEAERLYRIVGTMDPLARDDGPALPPPPPASPVDAELMQNMAGIGLNPYRLHVGFAYLPGCGECGGKPCPMRCKSDSRLICVEPALASGRATLRSECEVLRIEADDTRAHGVTYRDADGGEISVRARMVVLAAGAYRSPALLLQSTSPAWPGGLANRTDQVGRHLMFHVNEWFAVWPKRRASQAGPRKTIGLRDFYTMDGVRLGSIQSTGLSASGYHVYRFLVDMVERSRLPKIRRLFPLLKIPAKIAAKLFGEATVFVMIVEDLGYPDNRVVLDPKAPGRIRVLYTVRDELRERSRMARKLIGKAFRGLRPFPFNFDLQLNYGHACGTCRAGTDPATSVVDGDCKAHDVDNLYIVDSAFMPTSGGTNLGLTIIANALRVGDIISTRLRAAGVVAAEVQDAAMVAATTLGV